MKLEEVNAMTGEELRIKTALLTGKYRWTDDPGPVPVLKNLVAGKMGEQPHGPGFDEPLWIWSAECVPDYPNDIAAAWELVKVSGLQFQVGNTRHCSDSWWAKFRGGKPQVHAESAAKAITMAFILAMETE